MLQAVPTGLRWLLTIALITLIVALSLAPGHGRSGDTGFVWLVAVTPPTLQKSMHVAAYALLAALWAWTLASVDPRWLRLAMVFALCVALGGLMEWQQTHVPGRFGSLADALLNALGAAAGLLAAVLLL